MADAYVRTATTADALAIGQIQSVTWRAAYGGVLPSDVLRQLTPEAAQAQWERALREPPTAGHRVLVATEGDALVGLATVEPADERPADTIEDSSGQTAGSGSIGILLVEPRWGRRGHGSRLLAAATDTLAADAVRHVTTWVLEADDVTGSFLESAGWAADGTVRVLDAAGTPLRQIRMHVQLEDQA